MKKRDKLSLLGMEPAISCLPAHACNLHFFILVSSKLPKMEQRSVRDLAFITKCFISLERQSEREREIETRGEREREGECVFV